MNSNSILPVDFSRRTVLAPSQAVRGVPPFDAHSWAVSAAVREVNDTYLPDPPRSADVLAESIVMDGATITNSLRKGSAVVSQRRVIAEVPEPALTLVEPEKPPTLKDEAAKALERINSRRPPAPPRRVDPERPERLWWVWLVIGAAALAGAVLGLLVVLK